MLLRYVGPLVEVVVAPLDGSRAFAVGRGETCQVSDDVVAGLLEQDVWTTAGEDDSQ